MSRIFYSSLFAGFLLFSAVGCTKDDAEPEAESFFQVTQDGTAWQEAGTAVYNKGFRSFSIRSSKMVATALTHDLHIGFTVPDLQKPLTTGAFSVQWVEVVGGDGVSNQFTNSNTPGTPTLQITRLDTVRKVIEGRFSATLQRDGRYTQQQELMRLTDGSFRLNYQEQ